MIPETLLQSIGRAFLDSAGTDSALNPLDEARPAIADAAWQLWNSRVEAAAKRLELEELARASAEEIERAVRSVVEYLGCSLNSDLGKPLAQLLRSVPVILRLAEKGFQGGKTEAAVNANAVLEVSQTVSENGGKRTRRAEAATLAGAGASTIAATGEPRQRRGRTDVWQLLDKIEQKAPERSKLVTNSIGMKLVLIPEGTFRMGSPATEPGRRANEDPQHEVEITKSFYLAVFPVTQVQYRDAVRANPAHFSTTNGGGLDHPVEMVSWNDAVEFCRRLSALPEESGKRYRLPTEAEWEYACRGGTATPFSFGSSLGHGQANFDANFPYQGGEVGLPLQMTNAQGAYPANNFGLYDMHGNIWEWCQDWLDSLYYRQSPPRDPQGPAKGQFRVVRGGSWRNHGTTCRSAFRNGLAPTSRDMTTGFRVLLEI